MAPQEAPDLKGFSASNLWRMEQFYDVYVNKPKLAPQVRVLAWTHNLMIMGQNKRHEDREFYLGLAVKAKWSSREFAHQIKIAGFERTILSDKKVAALLRLLPRTRAASSKTGVSRAVLALPCPSGGINLVLLPRSRSLKCGREDGHRTQKMAEPGASLRHLDWLDYADLGFFSVLAAGFGAAFWLSPPCPWRRNAIQRNDCDLHLVFAGVVPRKTHG